MLSAHIEVKRHLTERAKDGNVLAKLKARKAYDCELDIAGILIQADHMLVELFDGSFAKPDERDDKMAQILEALDIRGLKAPSIWLRMVLAARRLLAGLPVTDDVAFGELDRFAVRVRDNQIQLFGLLLEGWQSLAEGRPVNAKFRAVQVLKLADESITYMRENACCWSAWRICAIRRWYRFAKRRSCSILARRRSVAQKPGSWRCIWPVRAETATLRPGCP